MIPAFPQGATISSLMIAFAQAGRLPSWRLTSDGVPIKISRNGAEARTLVQHVFGPVLTEGALTQDHTLAPIGRSLIDLDVRALAENTFYLNRGLRMDYRLGCLSLRLCPQCVEEDVEKYGCGHWRREHQIGSVRICTKHLAVLHDRCAEPNCGKGYFTCGGKPFLPGQPCPYCHGTATSSGKVAPVSQGYASYCKLFTDALHTLIPEMSWKNRRELWTLPHELYCGDIDAFCIDMGHWLGPRWGDAYVEYEIAREFLRDPTATSISRFIAPSLILLTAFKRFLHGHS